MLRFFPLRTHTMADHKAPTQVTIAPYEEASPLHKAVETYWKPFLGVAALVTALIIWQQVSAKADQEQLDASWDALGTRVDLGAVGGVGELPSPTALGQVAADLDGTIAGPWAKALEVRALIEDEDWAGAEAALAELESALPDHPLVTTRLPLGTDGAAVTMPEQQRVMIASRRAFQADHASLFSLPPLPADAPRVRLETTAGPIVVALYPDRAPEHVANFIKLASSGFYNNTKFHRVVPGFMIQGGDPNSKIGDPGTWGQGGPDYKVPLEDNDLFHFKGVLAAAKMGNETESSGSQFYITTGAAHHLDGKHTVFGVLEEGADVVRIVENSPVVPGTERPESPTTIESTTVVE